MSDSLWPHPTNRLYLLLFSPVLYSRFRRRQWHPTPVLLPGKSMDREPWWATVRGVAKSPTRLSDFTFTFHFHALEKEMATHSSVLAWRIPGTGKPGRLPSIGSHRVRHDWNDLAAAAEYLKHAGFCAGTMDRNKNKSRYSCSKSSWWWERQTNNSSLCSGLWISPGLGPERHGNPEKVEGCTGTRGWEGGRDESIQQEVVLKLRLAETWRPTEAG